MTSNVSLSHLTTAMCSATCWWLRRLGWVIEIGLAYGRSALAIGEALAPQQGARPVPANSLSQARRALPAEASVRFFHPRSAVQVGREAPPGLVEALNP